MTRTRRIERLRTFSITLLLGAYFLAIGPLCPLAQADPSFEISGATGFGGVSVRCSAGLLVRLVSSP